MSGRDSAKKSGTAGFLLVSLYYKGAVFYFRPQRRKNYEKRKQVQEVIFPAARAMHELGKQGLHRRATRMVQR
jgi:hypothetical protein